MKYCKIINSKNKHHDNKDPSIIRILVLGGSQAAKIFAEILPRVFKQLKDSGITIKVYQQCREEQKNSLVEYYRNANIESEVFNFTEKIIDYYSKANLVITRSGASVLGELINVTSFTLRTSSLQWFTGV